MPADRGTVEMHGKNTGASDIAKKYIRQRAQMHKKPRWYFLSCLSGSELDVLLHGGLQLFLSCLFSSELDHI